MRVRPAIPGSRSLLPVTRHRRLLLQSLGVVAIDMSAWDPASWAAAAAWVTVVIYLGVLLFAWRQVHEAKRLREEQARPFVVAYLRVDWLTEIVIENTGRTAARDVSVSFQPPLVSTLGPPWPWDDSTLLRDGIKTLAPGQKVRFEFDAIVDRFNREDLPLRHDATLTYQGFSGRRRYNETHVLDLGLYKGSQPLPPGLPALHQQLEKLVKEVHKWTDGINGLHVNVASRERQQRHQRWRSNGLQFRTTVRQQGLLAAINEAGRRTVRRALVEWGLRR